MIMKALTLSILQFNTFVKNILDSEEFLLNIGVFGEVTNLKVSRGIAYFDLKDENAMLSCIKFDADNLDIKNGDKIIVFGRVNFYVKTGKLSFVVSKTQAYGLGDLYQKFIELKNRLEKEGFFREEIKKSIPKYAKKIGVVTSETGAVIRDIINVTFKKNVHTSIVVFPSKVQGIGAEDELKKGIEYFNTRDDIDVIIVARGGGSIEDLAPFNTETIVKAVYNSKIPVISAVGHETDFTLCDFAADLRVPTPSVAAEVAVFDFNKECEKFKDTIQDIFQLTQNKITAEKNNLLSLNEELLKSIKDKDIKQYSEINEKIVKIHERIVKRIEDKRETLEKLVEVLTKINPLDVLKRGYSIVEKNGKRVSTASQVEVGEDITLIYADGKIDVRVIKKGEGYEI